MSNRKPTDLGLLRDLFHTCDPAPQHVVSQAYAASRIARDRTESDLLELIGDSADDPDMALTRSRWARPGSRVLTFAMPGRMIEMNLSPTVEGVFRASGVVLGETGQCPVSGKVVLRHPDGQCVATLDEHGAFALEDVPSGPVSLVYRPGSATPVAADWLVC